VQQHAVTSGFETKLEHISLYAYRWLDEFSQKIRYGVSLRLTYGGLISVICRMDEGHRLMSLSVNK
jgi:hypothetical protein